MKKNILTVAFATVTMCAMAQNKNVVSAINYLNYYAKDKNVDDLIEAKKYIDEAANNEETKAKVKTWAKRSEIYGALNSCKDEKVKALGINFLEEKFKSYQQVIALSTDKTTDAYKDANAGLKGCASEYFNKGGAFYNTKDYSSALNSFETSIMINKDLLQKTDTTGIYYAALCAGLSGNTVKAKQYYKQAIDLKYGVAYNESEGVRPYGALAEIYRVEKNDAEYFNIVQVGRKMFPNNKDLLNMEMNYYINNGKLNEAATSIDEAIAKDPTNKMNYLNKGILYDNLANPKEGKVDEKKYDEYFNKAVDATKKAVELDPNFFDALFQLGALYFNKGVRQNEFANTITGISAAELKKFEAESKKTDEIFKLSLPYFEKCETLGNTDKASLKALYLSMQQIYNRMEQPEKGKAMKEKAEKL